VSARFYEAAFDLAKHVSETRARVDEWIDLDDESDTGFVSEADAETLPNASEVLARPEGRLRDAQLTDEDDTPSSWWKGGIGE
jgi:hypothetical protein